MFYLSAINGKNISKGLILVLGKFLSVEYMPYLAWPLLNTAGKTLLAC